MLDPVPERKSEIILIDLTSRDRPGITRDLAAILARHGVRILDLAQALEVDIAFQVDNIYRRNRRLIAFDMDSTLIQTEVIDELATAAGVGREVAAITEAAMNGELDSSQSLLRRVSLLNGLDAKVLGEIAARLLITPGAERLIQTPAPSTTERRSSRGAFRFSQKSCAGASASTSCSPTSSRSRAAG